RAPAVSVGAGLGRSDARGRRRRVCDALWADGVEFEAGLTRLARGRTVVRPGDPVARPFKVEHELDLHVPRTDAEQFVVRLLGPAGLSGLAPDGPGDGVEQCALALPVLPREARHAERAEVQLGGGGAVREEVAEPEGNGNHGKTGRKQSEVRKGAYRVSSGFSPRFSLRIVVG